MEHWWNYTESGHQCIRIKSSTDTIFLPQTSYNVTQNWTLTTTARRWRHTIWLTWIVLKYSSQTAQKTYGIFIIKTNQLAHSREELVCSASRIKHIDAVCKRKVRFSNARPSGTVHKVTTGLQRDRLDPDLDFYDPVLLVALPCPSRRMSGIVTARNIKTEFSSLYVEIHTIFIAKLNCAACRLLQNNARINWLQKCHPI